MVLVDDASDMPHLKEPLDSYISRWTGKVQLVRSGEMVIGQTGLMRNFGEIARFKGGTLSISIKGF